MLPNEMSFDPEQYLILANALIVLGILRKAQPNLPFHCASTSGFKKLLRHLETDQSVSWVTHWPQSARVLHQVSTQLHLRD